ncbi:hypothetical protein VTJ83DRAFT_702 [Remersonia thermophila]|uniref:Uncharacterized protein n=1 Tax=Remersonia thermophila TaxID=72144 RepID=A0ABR4DMD3_9PEZI
MPSLSLGRPRPMAGPRPPLDRALHTAVSIAQRRDVSAKNTGKMVQIVIFALAAVGISFFLGLVLRQYYRRSKGHAYQPAHNEETSTRRQMSHDDRSNATLGGSRPESHPSNDDASTVPGIDRSTSVRSVMTLPAYRPKAAENEVVLGREGERDGIDVVVEMPTAEEEEALRDEEMEALYQIRAARRRQLAEREERRRARREAREAQDVVALRELRERARQSTARHEEELYALQTEHERIRETRQVRAVSSVSYADVGIARADGTRVRANSAESTERVALLSDTASIGAVSASSLFVRRNRSASGATLSPIDTARSLHDRPDSPGLSMASAASTPYVVGGRVRSRSRASSAGTAPGAGSPPEIIDAEDGDIGETSLVTLNMPPPPSYDEVSLSDATPGPSRRNSDVSVAASAAATRSHAGSRAQSPYPDPPPGYPGPAEERNRRLSARMEDLAAQAQAPADAPSRGRSRSRGEDGVPRLPSLRLREVPQIVIEPVTSARPT